MENPTINIKLLNSTDEKTVVSFKITLGDIMSEAASATIPAVQDANLHSLKATVEGEMAGMLSRPYKIRVRRNDAGKYDDVFTDKSLKASLGKQLQEAFDSCELLFFRHAAGALMSPRQLADISFSSIYPCDACQTARPPGCV